MELSDSINLIFILNGNRVGEWLPFGIKTKANCNKKIEEHFMQFDRCSNIFILIQGKSFNLYLLKYSFWFMC